VRAGAALQGDNYAYDIASRMAEAVGMGEGTIYP
jgi:hypothetical protein